MESGKSRSLWEEHARSCDPNDLLSQVRRTINGCPVGEDQIELIVGAVRERLDVRPDDVLLDLCCGNGAITDRILAQCRSGVGVDFSDYLISVAKREFETFGRRYVAADVVDFCCKSPEAAFFTKVLCFGSLQYIPDDDARKLFSALDERFPNVERMLVANHLDRDRISEFVKNGKRDPDLERSHETPLGMWRTRGEFRGLLEGTSWRATFEQMPDEFYGAYYRFDAILTRD
jgi:cyclopropane fatty-acyl-phospholipid synthase-like methyltransferase